MKDLQGRIKVEADSVIVHMDFAENYSFVVKNEVQGYHWTNNQLTIHPFYVQWCDDGETIKHKSYVILSDCLDHNAGAIECFRRKFVEKLKKDLPNTTKVYYASDNTGAQYKNYKNFCNLMTHEKDYNIKIEYHFSVSYHGKDVCDAINAVVKKSIRVACYRDDETILTAKEAFDFCERKLADKANIDFLFITQVQVSDISAELEKRYANCKTIPGTRQFHSFIPISESKIECRLYSSSNVAKVFDFEIATPEVDTNFSGIKLGSYVAYMTPASYGLGLVKEVIEADREIRVDIMRRKGKGNSFQWPHVEAEAVISAHDILCGVAVPETRTGSTYMLEKSDFQKVSDLRKSR